MTQTFFHHDVVCHDKTNFVISYFEHRPFVPCESYKFFPFLLFKLYMVGWTLGAIYSVPPIRTKKNPILAGLTIATVRGFLLNFGVYFAVRDAIGAPFQWSPKVSFIARFMTTFATVIAITKDLPDIEGDKVGQFMIMFRYTILLCLLIGLTFFFSYFDCFPNFKIGI